MLCMMAMHSEVYSIQRCVKNLLMTFLRVLRFIHQYNRNVVESGVKHHNPNNYSNERL